MYRVFISYSSIDRASVYGLGHLLEAMGHQVFIANRSIKPGKRWQKKLYDELDAADGLFIMQICFPPADLAAIRIKY